MTQLPPSPFISNSAATPEPPAVASTADSAYRLQNVARPDATAERDPHPNSVSPSPDLISEHAKSAVASSDLQPRATAELIIEPSSNERRPQEAPASAPTKNPDAGVLGTEHIHEIFFYVRKLMKQPPRFVLDADAFMAEIEEVPLFIREDGYLKRQA